MGIFPIIILFYQMVKRTRDPTGTFGSTFSSPVRNVRLNSEVEENVVPVFVGMPVMERMHADFEDDPTLADDGSSDCSSVECPTRRYVDDEAEVSGEEGGSSEDEASVTSSDLNFIDDNLDARDEGFFPFNEDADLCGDPHEGISRLLRAMGDSADVVPGAQSVADARAASETAVPLPPRPEPPRSSHPGPLPTPVAQVAPGVAPTGAPTRRPASPTRKRGKTRSEKKEDEFRLICGLFGPVDSSTYQGNPQLRRR